MLIAITGYKFSGKSLASEALSAYMNYEVFSFATPLKRMICALTGCTMEQLEIFDFKENSIVPEHLFPYCSDDRHNYRSLLQGLGDYMRDKNEDIFVDSTLSTCGKNAIISDLRFVNEARAVKEAGGIIIRIVRDGISGSSEHKSETQIDLIEPDYIICNNSSLRDFDGRIRALSRILKAFE